LKGGAALKARKESGIEQEIRKKTNKETTKRKERD